MLKKNYKNSICQINDNYAKYAKYSICQINDNLFMSKFLDATF